MGRLIEEEKQKKPFWQRIKESLIEEKKPEGLGETLIAEIVRPFVRIGGQIARLTPEVKKAEEAIKQAKELEKKIIELKPELKEKIPETKVELPPILQPRTKKQIIGDILEAGLTVAPLPAAKLPKGISLLKRAATLAKRGAAIGTGFGVGEALTEKQQPKEALKTIGIMAAGGAVLEPVFAGALNLAAKGIEKAVKIPSKISSLVPERVKVEFRKLLPVKSQLANYYGKEGAEIVNRYLKADENSLKRLGENLLELQKTGFGTLNELEKKNLLDVLEGRTQSFISPKVEKSFAVIDRLRKEIAQEAQELGVKVKLKKGAEILFQPRENYFPHYIPSPEKLEKNITLREEILTDVVRRGEFKTREEAEKALQGWVEAAKKEGRVGRDNWFVNYLVKTNQTSQKFTPEELAMIEKGEIKKAPKISLEVLKPEIPKELEPLAKEARKYKSAKEFIDHLYNVTLGERIQIGSGEKITLTKEEKKLRKLITGDTPLIRKWREILKQSGKTSEEILIDFYNQVVKGVKPETKLTSDLFAKLKQAQDEARGMILRYFKRARMGVRTHLEFAREFHNPFYDPNPERVITRWLMESIPRLEEIKQFGQKSEELNRLLGAISRQFGKDVGIKARQLVDVLFGVTKERKIYGEAGSTLPQTLRVLQIPKLLFSQIINLGQNLNTLLATDLKSFAYGLKSVFTQAGRERAIKAGVTLDKIVNSIAKFEGSKESKFAELFLRYTGFELTEKINRTVAVNAGVKYAERLFEKLKKNPTDTFARQVLEELGINAAEVLKRGKLFEDELLRAGFRIQELAQFRYRPADFPAFYASEFGRLMFQFKSFAYNQTLFLKKQLIDEFSKGRIGRGIRNLLIFSLIFPIGGEVLADIRSLIRGEKRPTNALDRYLSDIFTVGGVGIISDLLESARKKRLAETILGPALGSGTEAIETLVSMGERVVKGKEITPGQVRQVLQFFPGPIATTPLYWLFPPENQPKDRESILETIRRILPTTEQGETTIKGRLKRKELEEFKKE